VLSVWAQLALERVVERAREKRRVEEVGVVRNVTFIIIIIIIITEETGSLAALNVPRQCPLVHLVKADKNVEGWEAKKILRWEVDCWR
jgi:hypothetical protein